MNPWLHCLGSILGERLCIYIAGARRLMLRLGLVVLVLLQFSLGALLLRLRGIGPSQLSRLLTRTCQIASFALLLLLSPRFLPFLLHHPTIFLRIIMLIMGIGALIFLYDRWRA
jgi:hypothetical protein